MLAQHPTIQQAVVLAREDSLETGGWWLMSSLLLALPLRLNELRSFLQQKLPEYMVPSAFMFLESLPLTPNGKLDRKALPAPDQTRPELEETFSRREHRSRSMLANIWAEVLKLDQVGVHDNFFHLGGHSLLATQVISRIRDTFKLDLPLRSLFEAPTIDGLAQRVRELKEQQKLTQEANIIPIVRERFRIQ